MFTVDFYVHCEFSHNVTFLIRLDNILTDRRWKLHGQYFYLERTEDLTGKIKVSLGYVCGCFV